MAARTVAILGASSDRRKFGNKSVRAHVNAGYRVFPVNPAGGTCEGLPVAKSLDEVPVDRLDRISVYLPPHITLSVLAEIAAKGCDELWLNPGTSNEAVRLKAAELQLPVIEGCSIVDLGLSPAQFPDA